MAAGSYCSGWEGLSEVTEGSAELSKEVALRILGRRALKAKDKLVRKLWVRQALGIFEEESC